MNIRPTALLAAGLLAGSSLPGAVLVRGWTDKVDPWVLQQTEGGAAAEFLVVLAEQADLAGAAALATKLEKGRWVYERLTEVAHRTNDPVLEELARRGVEHRAYWVVNAIWVRGDREVAEAMARRSDVARVAANPRVPLRLPAPPEAPRTPAGIEPNLLQVGVLTFWDAGFTGENVVVGGQDTGYDWDHPALKDQYRGWDGSVADHNYNWHDAIHSAPGNPCGVDSPVPCDDNGHGTHTMGIMVGDDGGSNRIGMAPGARWMGCRNMDEGVGTATTYTECFQWFIAPTDLDGQNPEPGMAPHVINNSWGCPTFEMGCEDPLVLQKVVEATRAAGIVVVVSAGNEGPGCSTVDTPAAMYDASFTVGSVGPSDLMTGFSSRGPVTVDGSNRLKPDVSAPGESIRSSLPGTGYGFLSGTSMAGPHVAGLVALDISAEGCLAGEIDPLEDHIRATALQVVDGNEPSCGGIPPTEFPNNNYGWGSIRAALPSADLCLGIFDDGFESGDTSAWSQTVP